MVAGGGDGRGVGAGREGREEREGNLVICSLKLNGNDEKRSLN